MSRTRRYFGAANRPHGRRRVAPVDAAVRRPGHLGDFVGEIAFDLFDALAHLEADKAFDRDRRAQILGGLLDHLADLGLAVDHEGLGQQHGLFVEFAHPAFHHLLDDVFGLAGLARQFGLHVALALHHILGQMLGRDARAATAAATCMAICLASAESLALSAVDLSATSTPILPSSGDDGIVDIGRDHAGIDAERHRAAHAHILADLGDQFGQGLLHG